MDFLGLKLDKKKDRKKIKYSCMNCGSEGKGKKKYCSEKCREQLELEICDRCGKKYNKSKTHSVFCEKCKGAVMKHNEKTVGHVGRRFWYE